ncbi:MAG: hypothetical protein QM831_03520 [Kofleriaceae bacterium]
MTDRKARIRRVRAAEMQYAIEVALSRAAAKVPAFVDIRGFVMFVKGASA